MTQPLPEKLALSDRTGREIRTAFVTTPIAGVAAGAALNTLHVTKFQLDSGFDFLGLIVFYGIFGSLFASPTTLIGLPAAGAYIRASSYRPAVMTLVGFGLGWMTMMFWVFLFFGARYYQMLLHGYAIHGFILFCLVGAVCGALSGLLMSSITQRYSGYSQVG